MSVSRSQELKAKSPSVSTEAGIVMDVNLQAEKALSPIYVNEFGSAIDVNFPQPAKVA